MSRKREKPKKNLKKDQNVLVVLVEGPSEVSYLSYIKKKLNCRFKIKHFEKSKLQNDINEEIGKYSKIAEIEEEELVLIYDSENSSQEKEKFIENNKLKHKNTYLTQPCIEIHFLLHFKQSNIHSNQYYTADEALSKLLEFLPSYKKGQSFRWDLSGIDIEEIMLSVSKSKELFRGYDDRTFSTIGMFIDNHLLSR